MDNSRDIASARTYWTRHRNRPAVQRKTQRERPALFMMSSNLSPTTTDAPKPWYRREATLLDALVLCVCVVAGVALAFALGRV